MNVPEVPHISPETHEDFVLEKLAPVERTMVEQHVATCSSCRAALEEERRIAAGIRSFGRARMKKRLAESLAAPGRQPAPWGRILSAAAVLVVIAGIGIVYRWFTPGEQAPQIAETTTPVQAEKASREQPARPEENEPSARFRDKREAPARTGQTASIKESERSKDAPIEKKAAVNAEVESPDAALALSLPPSIWQTGQLAENPQPGQDESRLKSDQLAAPHAAGAQMQKRQDLAGQVQAFPRAVVRVLPSADLLLTGAADRTRAGSHGIPTQIVRYPDSLVFTLYTDLSFEGESLRHARVRQISPDSILLLIGERQISYGLSLQPVR